MGSKNRGGNMGRKGRQGGFIAGLNFAARLIDAAWIHSLSTIKSSKQYLELGYESWEEYCEEELGKSVDTVDRMIKACQELGAHAVRVVAAAGLKWRDIKMLVSTLEEETKKAVREKNVIPFGDKQIPIDEEHIDEIKAAVALLKEARDLSEKKERASEKKVEGLNKEHSKELQAYKNELEFLKAKLADPKLPEGFNEFIMAVERYTDEIVTIASKLHFDETFGGAEDEGPVKALYMKRLETVLNCFNHCINVLENAIGAKLPGRM